jgi:hypothetical protein
MSLRSISRGRAALAGSFYHWNDFDLRLLGRASTNICAQTMIGFPQNNNMVNGTKVPVVAIFTGSITKRALALALTGFSAYGTDIIFVQHLG